MGEVEMDPVPFRNFYFPRFLYLIGVGLRIVRGQDLPIHSRLSIRPHQKGKQDNAPEKKGMWRDGWLRSQWTSAEHQALSQGEGRGKEGATARSLRRIFVWSQAKRSRSNQNQASI